MDERPHIVLSWHSAAESYVAEIWWPNKILFATVDDYNYYNALERALLIVEKCWPRILDQVDIKVIDETKEMDRR
jgi:hypothetical protein